MSHFPWDRSISVFSLILATISILFAFQANENSRRANELSEEANRIVLQSVQANISVATLADTDAVSSQIVRYTCSRYLGVDYTYGIIHVIRMPILVSNNGGQSISWVNMGLTGENPPSYYPRYNEESDKYGYLTVDITENIDVIQTDGRYTFEPRPNISFPIDLPPGVSRTYIVTVFRVFLGENKEKLLAQEEPKFIEAQEKAWKLILGNNQAVTYEPPLAATSIYNNFDGNCAEIIENLKIRMPIPAG